MPSYNITLDGRTSLEIDPSGERETVCLGSGVSISGLTMTFYTLFLHLGFLFACWFVGSTFAQYAFPFWIIVLP